jgi:hypothetical protein
VEGRTADLRPSEEVSDGGKGGGETKRSAPIGQTVQHFVTCRTFFGTTL